jgi:integrase
MAEGIEVRHAKGCRARSGGRCSCSPSYRVRVWSQRERKRVRKTFASLAEAKSWRAEALVALGQGTLRAPVPQTVRVAAELWLDGARQGNVRDRSGRAYKPSTIRTYSEKLDAYVLPALGEHRLSELRRRDVQALADSMLASGLSPSTVRNAIDPLRAIYRRSIQRDEVAVNPTTNLDLPASRRKRERIASAGDAKGLLDALPPEERATWATAFYAGLRRGELRALRCSDVDLGRSEIRVARSWDQYEGAIEPKSEASARMVPLLAVLRDFLDEHLLATERSGEDLVLGRTPRDAFVASTVRSRAIRAWKTAGLEPITLHECRHTFASLLIASGENPKAVQEFMGHSTITETFDRYGHLFPGARDEARARMDAYLEAELARGPMMGQ